MSVPFHFCLLIVGGFAVEQNMLWPDDYTGTLPQNSGAVSRKYSLPLPGKILTGTRSHII